MTYRYEIDRLHVWHSSMVTHTTHYSNIGIQPSLYCFLLQLCSFEHFPCSLFYLSPCLTVLSLLQQQCYQHFARHCSQLSWCCSASQQHCSQLGCDTEAFVQLLPLCSSASSLGQMPQIFLTFRAGSEVFEICQDPTLFMIERSSSGKRHLSRASHKSL